MSSRGRKVGGIDIEGAFDRSKIEDRESKIWRAVIDAPLQRKSSTGPDCGNLRRCLPGNGRLSFEFYTVYPEGRFWSEDF
jgi:hypothetical protein